MNIKNISFSGWLQNFDSINHLLDDCYAFNYADCSDINDVEKKLSLDIKGDDISTAIGWSLGAQILVRLVSNGFLLPKRLILLAPPYQYVSDEKYPFGYNNLAFALFRNTFENFPKQCIKSFTTLMQLHDEDSQDIRADIDSNPNNYKSWLNWLDILGQFSCDEIDFSNFPETIIIHGMNDAVTNYKQSELFHKKIANSKLYLIENCGHMPHIHDINFIKNIINEECE